MMITKLNQSEKTAVSLVRSRLDKWDDYNRYNINYHPNRPEDFFDNVADIIYGFKRLDRDYDFMRTLNEQISDKEIILRINLKLDRN